MFFISEARLLADIKYKYENKRSDRRVTQARKNGDGVLYCLCTSILQKAIVLHRNREVLQRLHIKKGIMCCLHKLF